MHLHRVLQMTWCAEEPCPTEIVDPEISIWLRRSLKLVREYEVSFQRLCWCLLRHAVLSLLSLGYRTWTGSSTEVVIEIRILSECG
uniref:Uncharacterized protein n=2 Tax=Physcomitrium patens TaxID=3218 RepID=A0A2K1IMW9_PHYPA|nr:hypothetical protein PHYPA_026933 [Physcomitrium patens]